MILYCQQSIKLELWCPMQWPLATCDHWALCMWLVWTEMCYVSKNNTEFWSLDTKKRRHSILWIVFTLITLKLQLFFTYRYVKCTIKYISVSFYFFNVAPFFFFFDVNCLWGLYFDGTGWSGNQAHLPRDSHALRWRLTSDDQVEGRNIPWIGMDVEGIYLPKNGVPLFSYAEGSGNGQPKKGPSPTRRSAPGVGASLALGVQLLCSSTWIHNTGLFSWRGEEWVSPPWRTDGFRGSFSLARGAGIAGVESQPSTRRFRALTGCGRLSSQFSENNEHLHWGPPPSGRAPPEPWRTLSSWQGYPLAPGFTVSSSQPQHSVVPHGFSIPEAAAAMAELLPWAGRLTSPGVHSPSWLCSGYKVT